MNRQDVSVGTESAIPLMPPFGTYDTVEAHLTAYKNLRDQGTVLWDEFHKTWVATAYDTAKPIFMEPSRFARTEPNTDIGGARQIIALKGDEHKAMRRWFLQVFSPRNAESWVEGLIRPVLDGSIRRFSQRGSADLYSEYSGYLGLQVIANLLGLPQEDDEWLEKYRSLIGVQREYLEDSALWFDIESETDRQSFRELTDEAIAAWHEMCAMVEPYLLARKEHPTDDLISKLWIDEPLPNWGLDDMFSIVRNIFFGAVDTTKFALTNLLWLVLSQPELRERVANGDVELRGRMVEEGLRLLGPTQFRPRIVRENMRLGDADLRKGDTVVALQLCADRDASHFAAADHVDLERQAPRDHLAFGSGYAICLGAALARVELRVGLEQLFDRLPDVELDPAGEPPKDDGFLHKWQAPLHVRFTPCEF